jgi:hypothetical protein
MAESTLEIVRGSADSWTLTLLDDTASAITGTFTGSEALAASVWAGDDQAALFAPTAAWLSATNGTVTLSVSASDSATLIPGARYHVQLTVGTRRVRVGWLSVLPSPGTGTAARVYCTLDEVLALAPGWVSSLQETDDLSGLAEQRAKARKWTDGVIQAHYRRDTSVPRQDSLDHLLYGTGYRYPVHDVQLQTWLDDDRLILTTPTGERIKSANAYYTLHLICEGQIGRDGDDTFRRLSARYRSMAGNELSQCTAEIDTTTVKDGVGDLFIDLSVVDRIRS